eukprot:5099097-Prymnesium_polylepis.1
MHDVRETLLMHDGCTTDAVSMQGWCTSDARDGCETDARRIQCDASAAVQMRRPDVRMGGCCIDVARLWPGAWRRAC